MFEGELAVFVWSALASITAGIVVRLLSHKDDDSLKLELADFTKDLFAAAAAVFPTTLVVQRQAGTEISFTPAQLLGVIVVLAGIALWGRLETRYLSFWREGNVRTKDANGKLAGTAEATRPGARRMLAFAVGNGLGFAVLYSSTAISQAVAT